MSNFLQLDQPLAEIFGSSPQHEGDDSHHTSCGNSSQGTIHDRGTILGIDHIRRQKDYFQGSYRFPPELLFVLLTGRFVHLGIIIE